MTPTQEQIDAAQRAGNEAWSEVPPYLPGSQWRAYRAAYDATISALTSVLPERRCTCGQGYLTIPRYHLETCALTAAADEAGVTAEWTPAPTPDEMKRIAADAMQNQEPIEY